MKTNRFLTIGIGFAAGYFLFGGNKTAIGKSDTIRLTKRQMEVISTIEHLLGQKLEAKAINRKTIAIKIDDHRFYTKSDLYVKIARICQQYNLGRVEPNGVNSIAIIL